MFTCYFCDKVTPLKLFYILGEKSAIIPIIFHNPKLCGYLNFQICKWNEMWTFFEIVISFSNSRTLACSLSHTHIHTYIISEYTLRIMLTHTKVLSQIFVMVVSWDYRCALWCTRKSKSNFMLEFHIDPFSAYDDWE